MRVTLIVVAIAFASSPSLASKSCMTMSEARAAFGAVHLYWHGAGHCWDATPPRQQLAKRAPAKEPKAVAPEAGEAKTPAIWAHDRRWREAMSAMLPDDAPRLRTPPPALASDAVEAPAPRPHWGDRWVDITPRLPPFPDRIEPAELAAGAERDDEPIVTPPRVLLALLAVVLMLGIVEILFRATAPGWRR